MEFRSFSVPLATGYRGLASQTLRCKALRQQKIQHADRTLKKPLAVPPPPLLLRDDIHLQAPGKRAGCSFRYWH